MRPSRWRQRNRRRVGYQTLQLGSIRLSGGLARSGQVPQPPQPHGNSNGTGFGDNHENGSGEVDASGVVGEQNDVPDVPEEDNVVPAVETLQQELNDQQNLDSHLIDNWHDEEDDSNWIDVLANVVSDEVRE